MDWFVTAGKWDPVPQYSECCCKKRSLAAKSQLGYQFGIGSGYWGQRIR